MLKSLKDFCNKMFGRNKQTYQDSLSNVESDNNLPNNSSNNLIQNNMNNLKFVVPGHYALTDSLGDGKNIKMIRIIGPDTEREGYWLMVDENRVGQTKRISESTILNEYTPLKVDIPQHYKKTKNILGDIENVKIPEERKLQESQPKQELIIETSKIEEVQKLKSHISPVKETSKYSFDINIVNKCSIDNINNDLYKKYGEGYIKISDEPVDFNISVKLGYDISKIKQLVELLNLDINEISKYLANQIIGKIDLKRLISNRLHDMLNGSLESNKIDNVKEETSEIPSKNMETLIESSEKQINNSIKGEWNKREQEILEKFTKKNTEKPKNIDEKISSGLKEIDKLLENYL